MAVAVDMKRITRGKVDRPPRVLIYGLDGVGKTQFASGAPKPFFLDANRGRYKFNVDGVDIFSWDDYLGWLQAIESNHVSCETVVSDALFDFEWMIAQKLFPGISIVEYKGGYKQGEGAVAIEWRQALNLLERIWMKGKTVILIGHAAVRRFADPTGSSYDRFEISCVSEVAGALRQWSDYVFFAREEVKMESPDSKKRKVATTTGVRWVYTRRSPAYDAKARGSNEFPERIPLSWAAFVEAVTTDSERGAKYAIEIEAMLKEMDRSELTTAVREYLRAYPNQITDAYNRVKALYEEHLAPKDSAAESQEKQ